MEIQFCRGEIIFLVFTSLVPRSNTHTHVNVWTLHKCMNINSSHTLLLWYKRRRPLELILRKYWIKSFLSLPLNCRQYTSILNAWEKTESKKCRLWNFYVCENVSQAYKDWEEPFMLLFLNWGMMLYFFSIPSFSYLRHFMSFYLNLFAYLFWKCN